MEKAEEDPWSDRAGVREVLHRVPGVETATSWKPRYTQYLPLQDFEEIKASLAQEVIPVRRYSLSDYKVPEVASPAELGDLRTKADEVANGAPFMGGAFAQPSGRGEATNAEPPRSKSPRPDAVQVWLAAKERALQSPRQRIAMPHASPCRARATRAVGKLITESEKSSYDDAAVDMHAHGPQLHVSHVNPMSLTMRKREPRDRGPFIRDKERGQYPSGRGMRPVRETNEESLKKLIENLGSTARVDAKESHPSRSVFNTIPKPNLRVL